MLNLNLLCSVEVSNTGACLFLQECLLGALSSKTVVYVTHQIEFLPAADLILVRISLVKLPSIIHCNKTDASPY
jgi:hypothetical protein